MNEVLQYRPCATYHLEGEKGTFADEITQKELFPNPYIEYEGAPIIIGPVMQARQKEILRETKRGNFVLLLPSGKTVFVPRDRHTNKVIDLMDGLMEDLEPGWDISNLFYEEYLQYQEAFMKDQEFPRYGTLVYYPTEERLVTVGKPFWHRTARLARNSLLMLDEGYRDNFDIGNPEIVEKVLMDKWRRENSMVIGVAGASVGKAAFMRLIQSSRPWMKIADWKPYKDTNANRAGLNVWELGENKAIVAALQAHKDDPFLNISVYSEGIHEDNILDFIVGNERIGEPPIDILVEETDDPEMKLMLRDYARMHGKIVLMITDIGTAYQIDIRNFRDHPQMSLAVGVEDEKIMEAKRKWEQDKSDRDLFLDFAFKLIGGHWKHVPEFNDLILENLKSPFGGGIPQLGAAAYAGASRLSVLIPMAFRGVHLPERIFVDLKSGNIEVVGPPLPEQFKKKPELKNALRQALLATTDLEFDRAYRILKYSVQS